MGPLGSAFGANGTRWYTGTEAPPSNTIGSASDLYLNTATSDVYVKSASGWELLTSIKGDPGSPGAPGADGADGADGANGTNGADGTTIRYASAQGGVYTGLNCGDLIVIDVAVPIVLPSAAYSPGFYFDILSICGDFSGAASILTDSGSIIDDSISPTDVLWGGNPAYYPNRRFCQCRVHFLGAVDYWSLPVWLLTNNTHFSTSPGGF